ncbi:SDR family NAD(P)-dependent oxidoreductase [Hymenobacter sp. YC55]|uniref:SDR family NAD(P)-dependent oxidoreductase n=1 Tax=Hymenobacter sp. YC55 TaxID=3034019 RepID=UPI0023F6CA31|nr:SDR family NAD(P)-dependent oxidoreductase [Hymenobacter sp. YC55]MDF7813763.1 SDR family NAD(P)-dependent oxidoreductase [Hymenobacter sp. YC55]
MKAQHGQATRIALVTGANQGIGLQVAKELVANGYTVLVGSRNLTKGEEAATGIGAGAIPIQLDVTNSTSIAKAAERIHTEYGRIDVLVNNAGISQAGRANRTFEEATNEARASMASLEEVKAIWETNVFGVIAVTQAMLPFLKESAAGRIINVSSALGSLNLNADPTYPYRAIFGVGYAASKTALNAVTLSFAIELETSTITVNAASPGFPATALNNFQGTETIEVAARNIVRAALDESGVTGTFTGSDGALPW